jgi:hypothetical protein
MLGVARLLLCVAAPTAALAAQVQVLDRGSVTWRRDGTPVAREEFSIRQVPETGGTAWIAQATVVRGAERILPALRADSAGHVLKYQVEVRQASGRVSFTAGEAVGGRWIERGQRGSAETAREFAVADGAFLYDPTFAHQLTLLLRAAPPTAVPVLRPGARSLTSATVRDRGAERVVIGTTSIDARRYEVRLADGTAVDAWADAAGRILRVSFPADRLVAEREDPPLG